jgi:hypothetical protein
MNRLVFGREAAYPAEKPDTRRYQSGKPIPNPALNYSKGNFDCWTCSEQQKVTCSFPGSNSKLALWVNPRGGHAAETWRAPVLPHRCP